MRLTGVASGFEPIYLLAQQVATVALDLLFPPHCVACERVGSFLCARCARTLTPSLVRTVDGLDEIRTAFVYANAASTTIQALKYEGQKQLAQVVGAWIVEALDGVEVDCVTAVPLHPQRLTERGYNQAALLARYVADQMGWAYIPQAVARVRETSSQVHLNARERRANVERAFVAQPAMVAGQRVLLIDDVLTTGATLAACADALRAAGAACVVGATAASAVLSD